MSELAADGIPVAATCRVLKIARQPYYRWLARPVTAAELEQACRANALFDAHRDDPEFGYRFLVDEARDAGVSMADRTAWRICSAMGWWSAFGKKKRGKNCKRPGPPVHDDLVRRDFTATVPNQLWLADITEHKTSEGKLYLCAVKDVYSNRIVGYSLDARMKSRLAVAALNNAVARRIDVAGCVLHTDRGSQGEFNRSSQHFDHGGVQWDERVSSCRKHRRERGGSGLQTGRCEHRCARPAGRSRHALCSESSGASSHPGSQRFRPRRAWACRHRSGFDGSDTLAGWRR